MLDDHNKKSYEEMINRREENKSDEKKTFINIAEDILKNDPTVDIGSLVKIGINLLKDETIMSALITSFVKFQQGISNEFQKREGSRSNYNEDFTRKLSGLKRELREMKKQNERLIEALMRLKEEEGKKEYKNERLAEFLTKLKEEKKEKRSKKNRALNQWETNMKSNMSASE